MHSESEFIALLAIHSENSFRNIEMKVLEVITSDALIQHSSLKSS